MLLTERMKTASIQFWQLFLYGMVPKEKQALHH